MWTTCFLFSVGSIAAAIIFTLVINKIKFADDKRRLKLFKSLLVGVFFASVFMFYPIRSVASEATLLGNLRAFLLAVFNAMQVYTIGCEFDMVEKSMAFCPDWLDELYMTWVTVLFVLAPVFTFGFILSLFKNLSAYLKYFCAYFKDTYVFSELNDKSLALANDLRRKKKDAAIIFTDVFEDNEENIYELIENAKEIGAICFKKDMLVIDFKNHSVNKGIYFFAIGNNETENLNQSLKLIENYRERSNTHIYVFSAKIESEILLTSVDKGKIKVRRINNVQSLVNRVLYEGGEILFESAAKTSDGTKNISAVVIGMGRHGTEMVKALAWFGQMDGYSLEINAFDKDPLAEEKFIATAPELMSPDYNGVTIDGEAQYKITIHPGIDVESISFVKEIAKLRNATYVIVALGNDDVNVNTSINLRMYFERMKIHPVIQTIVYNSQQRKALCGIKNYGNQEYDIDFIGDVESSYTEDVIIDSELEEKALEIHMKWGEEEEFWTYEYNYRSSMASAIHMRARIKCGIPGAEKKEEELTPEERDIIEVLEHRRWNAYMRAEGYVYSGSKDKSSRNDLAKMHHDLIDYTSLDEEEKRKDSRVGTG
ncbi:MAG: hypothetical protein E7555_08470 [Ruminococcaceae bacterium]|nr:hypothetical protein [Oscillospiraceae bacterium]